MIRRATIPAVFLFFSVLPSSLANAESPVDAQIKKMLETVCSKHKIPSLTIAVVRADKVETMQCSGVRKRGANDAVALSDRHPIGSCTKSMTATLAAILVQDGKIEWDTTIGQVWPTADSKNLHPSLKDVTLNELLSHQSGVISDLGNGKDWISFFAEKKSPPLERRRMLPLILKLKPKFTRGSYNYANLGFVIAAAMMETKCRQSYEDMMRERVFKPLKMDSADFRTMAVAKNLKQPLLWGHTAAGAPVDPRIAGAENPSVYASCGTLNLTIADYAKYAQWHLANKPAPLLNDDKNLKHLHTPQVDAPTVGGKYGCGWIFAQIGPFGQVLTHGGSNTNSQALIWIIPDKDFAAIACTNTGEKSGMVACDEAIGELMKRFAM